jgi:hypothetical protein
VRLMMEIGGVSIEDDDGMRERERERERERA